MTFISQTKTHFTEEEYLALEEVAKEKHEYFNGKVRTMAGATPTHNEIAVNISTAIRTSIKPKKGKYRVYNSDTRIRIEAFKHYVYPDVLVICEKPSYYKDRKDTIVNPLLIVEVLSKSTKEHDRTTKFDEYRTLDTFKEYLLVAQDQPHISQWMRKDKNLWEVKDHDTLEGKLYLPAIDCEIAMADVYEWIEFEKA